ncbi:winged helix-turn-helix transcriptional regulator [Streptomyces sp. RLB3-17]|uniref:Winged helix-turn-helix domain-containing protein n=1 Tax=Streptomyces mirabilis TaxID=68239 RepID=A0ABU3V4E8_9ACTN|nr:MULTISPECIES: winged helix-turn-helix domain-containing protein [Streptomyces]MCX4426058.1 winged helix-turn-helix domain-containing protein [Streptomyces mirabilis]MCX5356166.1 winged helix-turn-helix domain-containing protein [Streptomyces mirabilis]MDU9000958.1 winged helix-turn-helix domain-containing protein [Streptomyces mirabilis]QDN95147.1 winged helix-turn-helix transcriptional regulator [Streptomyces sp. RLB1-9]QDO16871.1 winged helix-turn-helix transcriptional regulator [Streptom
MSTQGSGASPRRWHGVHKALADPLRIRLLEALWEMPQSARELADHVDLPADRLYYHLNQLERVGLIEIAEYRPLARGKVERVYTPAVTEPPSDAANPKEMAEFLGSMLDATRADINAAYRSKQAGGRREVDLHRGALRLTDEALAELRGHIERLATQFGDRDAPGVWTRVVITVVDLQDRPSPDAAPRA